MQVPRPRLEIQLESRRLWRPRRWTYLGLLGAVVLAVLIVLSVVRPPRVEANLRTAVVQRGDLALGVDGYGKLIPADLIALGSKSGGTVLRIDQQVGATVEQGAAILLLSNPDVEVRLRNAERTLAEKRVELESELASALYRQTEVETGLENARDELAVAILELEALQKLADAKIIAAIDYRKAQLRVRALERRISDLQLRATQLRDNTGSIDMANAAALAALREDVSRARRKAEELVIRAPVRGTIFELLPDGATVGSQIPADQTVARLSPRTEISAEISVPASRAGEISIGQPAELEVNGKRVTGRVGRIGTQVVRDELLVTVVLDSPEGAGLVAGQPVSGRVITRRLDDVLYLARPSGATAGRESLLFEVVEREGNLRRRTLEFGSGDGRNIVVERGAREGMRFVLEDMDRYADHEILRR